MKRYRTVICVAAFGVAVFFALVLGSSLRSRFTQTAMAAGWDDEENQSCSLATLHGSSGSGTTGLINSSSDPSAITIGTFVPYAEVALFKFDGRGSFTATAQPDLHSKPCGVSALVCLGTGPAFRRIAFCSSMGNEQNPESVVFDGLRRDGDSVLPVCRRG